MPKTSWAPTATALVLSLLFVAPAAFALDTSTAAVRVTGADGIAATLPALTGAGVVVAVIDTGVDDEHPTFRGAYATGVDLSSTPDVGSAVADAACANPDDTNGHGTHVAGIALGRGAATGENRGVAPGARLVDVKVTAEFTGAAVAGVARGLKWVKLYNENATACHHADFPRIHVVSVSMGGPGSANDAASTLVDELVAAGVVVVAAAGNCGPASAVAGWPTELAQGPIAPPPFPGAGCETTGPNTVASPALAAGAIAVVAVADNGTATRVDDALDPRSSQGSAGGEPKPNLGAPGVNVRSAAADTTPGSATASGWVEMSGTSMAAPHVSGIAAILLQAAPALKPADVKRALQETAEDLGAPGHDPEWGHGYVDARAALQRVLLTANAAPKPDFRVSCLALTCTFDASPSTDPDGALASFAWDFGDDARATGVSAEHRYAYEGDWRVTLTVTDAAGATAALARVVRPVVPPPPPAPEPDAEDGGAGFDEPRRLGPHANATVTPPEGPVGTRFAFDASRSSDADGRIVSFAWDVDGDGIPEGEGPTFEWAPHDAGTHVVRLLVVDDSGLRATHTLAVRALPAAAAPPAEAADQNPPRVTIVSPQRGVLLESPLTVQWDARDDESRVRAVVLVLDGREVAATVGTSLVLHADPGDHVLVVRATDDAGNVGEAETSFTVLDPDPRPPVGEPPELKEVDARTETPAAARGDPTVPGPGFPALAAAVALALGLARLRRGGRRA